MAIRITNGHNFLISALGDIIMIPPPFYFFIHILFDHFPSILLSIFDRRLHKRASFQAKIQASISFVWKIMFLYQNKACQETIYERSLCGYTVACQIIMCSKAERHSLWWHTDIHITRMAGSYLNDRLHTMDVVTN